MPKSHESAHIMFCISKISAIIVSVCAHDCFKCILIPMEMGFTKCGFTSVVDIKLSL